MKFNYKLNRKLSVPRYSLGIFRYLVLFFALFVTSQIQANIEFQRELFKDASTALSNNKMNQFADLLTQLEDYPVAPYLKYDHFVKRLQQAKASEVKSFLDEYKDYPFAFAFRGKWLSVLAARQDWENYLQFIDNRNYTRLKCIAFQERLKLGR